MVAPRTPSIELRYPLTHLLCLLLLSLLLATGSGCSNLDDISGVEYIEADEGSTSNNTTGGGT
ncbi:MAG: hypothetical protein CMH57_11400, partial [Myxococcales bacterium]|nr:hypothetical protein [Myxococcales bacterium]